MQLGQPAAALRLVDEWFKVHDDDVKVHDDDASLGGALHARCWARSPSNQMLNDALSDCRNAIRRDGNKPAYLRSLGLVQLRLGHYAKSIKAYQQAVTLMPKSAWAWYGLGLAELHSGQVAKGNADLAGARVLEPTIDARAAKFALTASGK